MKLVRHIVDIPHDQLARGSVVSIGAFDGLHLGHEALLERVIKCGAERNLPTIIMSFEPTPREFFSSDPYPARLMRFREKFDELANAGIDIFFCPRFSSRMRNIGATEFVRQILIQGLNASHVVVGDDFRFAWRREGDINTLNRCAAVLNFTVEDTESLMVEGLRASSTAIRKALAGGDLPLATTLLGRPYRMSGKIVRGRQMGRKLGFATANVDVRRRQSAVAGIYAVRVTGIGDGSLDGVANVGVRPTFDLTKPLLEVHIFDFDQDIYGQTIHVDFIEYIRAEKKFANVDELVAQIRKDEENARSILKRESES